MITGTFTDADGASNPGTVVEDTEEILEDGTVVRHKIIKTTEKHIESEDL